MLNLVNIGKLKKTEYSGKEPKEDDFNFDLIGHYFKNKDHFASFQTIDNQLINDLDLQELFMYIDRTHSKIGQQYLYNQLLSINRTLHFEEQEDLINYLTEHKEKRIKIQSLLSKLNKRDFYYISNLFLDEFISKPKWYWVVRILSIAGIATLLLSFLFNKLFILLLIIYIINMLFYIWNKNNILIYSDSIPQLMPLCKIAKEFVVMGIIPKTKIQILSSANSINGLKNQIRFFKSKTGVMSEIESVLLFFREIINIMFLIEPQIVFNVLGKLDKKRNEIHTLFEYIGKIDSAISIASMRTNIPHYCIPTFFNTNKITLDFTDIYHPLIPDCVSNSLQIQDKSILLTGSNMSGKTTFIRTVALNVLFAQTLNTCFAKTFKLSQTRLFSAIRIADDLFGDKSYFFEEVLTIKNMITESLSDCKNIFLLDEIFKGTNTVERIAAGKAVLSYLTKLENNIVFVSTHDIELADLLKDTYELYHFTEVIQEEQIHFDYKLKRGKLSTKNAIRILEINNYPPQITEEARRLSTELEYNRQQADSTAGQ
ncbi:MAG: DNA mismatch repair protein MutS [Paludibacter sp.]|nr:DNA mismatch repair protein MutS [Paludibacter sp.]